MEQQFESDVVIDFYKIDRKEYQLKTDEISLHEVLVSLLQKDHLDRKWDLKNYTLEMPFIESREDGQIQGMCIKYRKSDLPLTRDSKTQLPKKIDIEELGEGCSFLFIHPLNIILLERNHKILSPSRFLNYMSTFSTGKHFNQILKPIINHYSFDELKKQFNKIQKFTIRGAFARNANFLQDCDVAVKSVPQLVRDYGDVNFELTMGTRSRKKTLLEPIWDFLKVAMKPSNRDSLGNLEITGISDKSTGGEESIETESMCLNLISNKLSFKSLINSSQHYDYNERKVILGNAWMKHKDEIESYLGGG